MKNAKIRLLPSMGILLALGALAVGFQNCGQANFEKVEDPVVAEQPAEAPPAAAVVCKKTKRLGIWLDKNENGSVDKEEFMGSILPYKGDKTCKANYNYFSASAHPIVGPKPAGFKSHVFFYEGTDGLCLTFFSNVDAGGSPDNHTNWDIETKGNQKADAIAVQDDYASEFDSSGSNSDTNFYKGRFHYTSNTDGGAIAPFKGEEFEIKIRVLAVGDIQNVGFYSSDEEKFSLSKGKEEFTFFIGFLEECK